MTSLASLTIAWTKISPASDEDELPHNTKDLCKPHNYTCTCLRCGQLARDEALIALRFPHDHLDPLSRLYLLLANCYNRLRDLKLHNSQMREFLELWPDVPMAHKCGVRWNR